MIHELHHNIEARTALDPAAVAADGTLTGAVIDLQGFGAAEFVVLAGTVSDGTHAVTVQEGAAADGSDMADVPAERLLGALPVFAASDDNATKRVGFVPGTSRYARLRLASSGVSLGIDRVGAVCLLGQPGFAPRP